ncbi:MAG: flippase-like domain-containing protein, partial [Candidatus Delongbacteria bacterium]|nr:flippase-like domain-containing protein [Candidatus Delongbacteria bacterium]
MNLLKNEKFIKVVKLLLLALVLFFVVKNVVNNFSNIKDIDLSNLNYGYVLPALLVTIVSLFIPVFAWKYLLGTLGSDLKISKAMRIWFISNLGRYIPGKVWQISGLIVLSSKEGVSKKVSSISVIYSQIVANLIGLSLGIFLFVKDEEKTTHTLMLVGVLIALAILPFIINKLAILALSILKKPKETFEVSYGKFIIYVFMQLVNWLVMGLAFVLFINIFTELSIIENSVSLFILPISWTLGLLAIFAPGGIGVREGIMTVYLSMFISPGLA